MGGADSFPRPADDAGDPPLLLEWEHFPHSADVGVRGFGASCGEAFAAAALAMTAAVCEPAEIPPRRKVTLRCAAPDCEILLLDWLNALVFEMARQRMLFSRFEVDVAGGSGAWRLLATAWGAPLEALPRRPAVEVKGATLTELRVCRDAAGRWLAQCVVDV